MHLQAHLRRKRHSHSTLPCPADSHKGTRTPGIHTAGTRRPDSRSQGRPRMQRLHCARPLCWASSQRQPWPAQQMPARRRGLQTLQRPLQAL